MSLGSLQQTLLIYMFKLKKEKEKEQIIILPVSSTHCYLFPKRIGSPKNWPSVLRSQVMTMSQIWIVTQKSDRVTAINENTRGASCSLYIVRGWHLITPVTGVHSMRDGMQVATVRDGNDRLRLGKFRKSVLFFTLP